MPTGYWRRPSGDAVLDPDEQVRTVVHLVFAKFAELGTINAVMRFLVEEGIEIGIRMRTGPQRGEVLWKRPVRSTITCMLNNPIYAGVYVYGRRRGDPARRAQGGPHAGRSRMQEQEWIARIEDALPAYISLEQFRANQARLAANAPHGQSPGAIRSGPALLAGVLRCGRCRRRITVTYHVDAGEVRISYDCSGARAEFGGAKCQSVSGACLDQYIADQVLAILATTAIGASIQAAEQAIADRAEVEKIWRLRLERARIEVERAQRCYRLAEPENRLVVRHLEADWEKALASLEKLTEDLHRFTQSIPPTLTAAERAAPSDGA